MAGSTVKTEAVVLRSIRYSEADRILHMYSPTLGRFGAIAKGARKPKSRFGGRLEPFFRLDLVLHQGRSDLMTVTSVSTVDGYPRLRSDGAAIGCGARACDAVLRLLAAYEAHLSETNPVFDFPTVRVLRQAIAEETQMVVWGTEALTAVTQDETARAEAEAWQTHLRAYLMAAGGVSGTDAVPEHLHLPPARAIDHFVPDVDPKRDSRSGDIYNFLYRANGVYLDPEADWDERNLALMYKRYHEMDVPEMMASIVLQTKDQPWEYYRDMGRQLWDEARHSMMGEVWFARSGPDWARGDNHVGWSLHLNLDRSPLERHIILYYIEQSLMNGETGKRWEWLIAQRAGDPLATYFQDYDWADEVLHAQIGRRWLKPQVGTVKQILEEAARITEMPTPTLDAHQAVTPQVDWWPQFVREVLGKESTSTAGIEEALVPHFETIASG